MNVKNVRPLMGRPGSKSFHVTTLKRQKTEALPYKSVATEFNNQFESRSISVVSPNNQSKRQSQNQDNSAAYKLCGGPTLLTNFESQNNLPTLAEFQAQLTQ